MLYVFGDYSLDTQAYALSRAGASVHVRPKVFQVLAYLLTHRDRVVPKPELMEHVWPGQSVSDETLDSCMALARRAVGDSARGQAVIQTRHGVGHRFVAAVEVRGHPPLAAAATAAVLASPESQADAALSIVPVPTGPLASRHTPPQRLLAGEQKLVTVLVCTLAHAAALMQRLEAEVWHQVLQAFYTASLEAVQRYGGTLQHLQDDGIRVLFGAPVAQEDHARRAVRAALGLQQRFQMLHVDAAWPLDEACVVCQGLHTGRIFLGSLGDDGRLTSTAVGDTTQRATWLAQQAAPDTILISAATARLVHGEVRLEACPSLPRLGSTAPSPTYQVLGLRPQRTLRLADGARPRSRFVGRALELATLQALLARVAEGQGQVVGIVGEPGMGKTRLLTEFRQRLGDARVTYLEGRCVSYGQATPYLPIQDLLRHACGCTEADRPAAITANVQQHLQAMDMAPSDVAPFLLHLLGMPDGVASLVGRSPQEIRTQTFATLHQLLWHESQRQPLLVVVENLHWIDPTSQAYLTELVERLANIPLLLLVTFRPGYRPPWMEKSYATQLALPRLSPEDSRGVVQAVLHPAPVPESLMQGLLTKAAGNPLFLEELAWTVREHGDLRLPPEVPDTIRAVLAARIDRLPPETKQVLQTAAVIGMEVPISVLQAISELPEATLHYSLAHLQTAEFLYETSLFAEPAYTFKHALTQEVAYSSLLQERRRGLHARIVAALEGGAGNQGAVQVERLAHHALRGAVWDTAVTYCRQAGTKAYTGSAYREAVGYWEQALEALAHLPPDRCTMEQAADVHSNLYHALHALTQHAQMLTHLRAAESLAEGLADHQRLGIIYRSLANTLRLVQDYKPALAYSQQAHAIATTLGDVELQLESSLTMAWIAYDLGDYRQALKYLQQALMTIQGTPRTHSLDLGNLRDIGLGYRLGHRPLITRTWMVACFTQLGAFADGLVCGAEALQLAEAVNHPYDYLSVYRRVGWLHVRQGALHQAIPVLEQGVALSQEADMPIFYHPCITYLALAYALAGRATDALAVLGQSERFSVIRGEAYLRAGEVEEADRLAQHGLANIREYNKRGDEAWALWLLGEIAMHRDPPDLALANVHYQQALALAEDLGMRPLVAHCHHGLGQLYATLGQREQAHAALCSAITLYRAMEMAFWLPPAERALAEVVRSPYL